MSFSADGYALLDGGHFDDLPAQLKRVRLFGRSLYLEQVDIDIQAAGPWLVPLAQAPEAAGQVFEFVDQKPAAVFWCCNAGEAVLHKHLRTLNMARIPDWAAAGKEERDLRTDAYSLVFFRHFDPRVLGALLPTFDAKQLGRFVGPAEEVAFLSEEYGFKRVLSKHVISGSPATPLEISSDQIHAMYERRTQVSNHKIGLFLRKYASKSTNRLSDKELYHTVASYSAEARSLGIKKEASIGIWAYMQMTSRHDDLYSDRATNIFLADERNGADIDARLRAYLRARSEAVE